MESAPFRANYDISFIILTYNPDKTRLLFTLRSLLDQQNINYEIIISDDGSKDNLFDIVEKFMEEHDFHDYKLICHNENRGTVYNSYDAICASKGDYIKLISPGDALSCNNIISQWLIFIKKEKKRWSFCNSVYYNSDSEGNVSLTPQLASPQFVGRYNKKNTKRCRWDYVVMRDYVLGAATLCERALIIDYTKRILDHVIYGEDVYYWMMMFDNITPAFFDKYGIIYEFGPGISSSRNPIWTERLNSDWSSALNLISEEAFLYDKFQLSMLKELHKKIPRSKCMAWVSKLLKKGHVRYWLRYNIFPRKTPDTLPDDCSLIKYMNI